MNEIDQVTRSLPHAVGSEKSVLSSLFKESQEFFPLAHEERLSSNHFYLPSHAIIFETLSEFYRQSQEIELVSFIQHLIDFGKMDRCGGPSAITDIFGYVYTPTPSKFRTHIREIRQKQVGRALIQFGGEVIASVYDSPGEILETLATTEAMLSSISMMARDSTPPRSIKNQVIESIDAFEMRAKGKADSMGIQMIPEIDRYLMGAHPGRMIVIGGYPEAGKSLLALQMILDPVTSGEPCFYLSLELSERDATNRAIIQHARIQASIYNDPRGQAGSDLLNNDGINHIRTAAMTIAASPLRIKRADNRKLQTVVAEIRKAHREMGIKIAVIDYAQKIVGPKSDSRVEEYKEISHTIYELAVELGITIILPSQLNSDGDTEGGRVFEQDADAVLNIVQDRNKESETYKQHRHILIVKDRHNSKGGERIAMILDKERLRFVPGLDETAQASKKPKFAR